MKQVMHWLSTEGPCNLRVNGPVVERHKNRLRAAYEVRSNSRKSSLKQ